MPITAKKVVLIGGGTGLIGTALCRLLKCNNYFIYIVSRRPGPYHLTWEDLEKNGLPQNTSAVFSLAGQNVFDFRRRWTPGFKQNVYASRINTTQALARAIELSSEKPKVFISISGVGYYPPSKTEEYTEESEGGNFDFLSNLTQKWENASQLKDSCKNVRRAIVRSGVVLGREGGIINQMYLPFFLGLGGPVGTGEQYMPWIHLHDISGLLLYLMENESTSGIYNGVAPQIITNKEFAKSFGRALWRPAIIPLPKFVLDFAFDEERAKIMTEGQRVLPKRTLESGFTYDFPDINSATKQCSPLLYSEKGEITIK